MKNNYKILIGVISLVMGIILLYAYNTSLNTYQNFKLTSVKGYSKKINLPYSYHKHHPGTYTFSGEVVKSSWGGQVIRIIPDDKVISIKVNGDSLDLSQRTSGKLNDFRKGFEFDFAPFFDQEVNQIEIRVMQIGPGIMGLKMKQPSDDLFANLATVYLIALSVLILSWFRFSWGFIQLFAIGWGLRLIYFSETTYDLRSHDLSNHYHYILYMAKYWLPPSIEHAVSGAFFHPPIYYYLAAITHQIAEWFRTGPGTSYYFLQCLSLAFSMVFLFYGLQTIKYTFEKVFPTDAKNEKIHQLVEKVSGLLLVCWPSLIIHSVRIGNDPLMYAFYAPSLYYLTRWYIEGDKRYVFWSALWGGLCVMTKANGVILFATILIAGFIRGYIRKEIFKNLKQMLWPVIFFSFAIGITFAPGVILKLKGKRETVYVSNINQVSSRLVVGNSPKNFLYFDLKTFLTEAYTSPWDDKKGRQYFWNYTGKTGLFGEFKYAGKQARSLAELLSFLSIILVGFCVCRFWLLKSSEFIRLAPYLINFSLLLMGLAYMRATFPVNVDFRYILPIIIPFSSFVGASALYLHQQGSFRSRNFLIICSLVFSLLSALFFASLRN